MDSRLSVLPPRPPACPPSLPPSSQFYDLCLQGGLPPWLVTTAWSDGPISPHTWERSPGGVFLPSLVCARGGPDLAPRRTGHRP